MTVLREANAVLVQALNQSQQQESESAPPQGSRVCSTGGAAAKDRQQQGGSSETQKSFGVGKKNNGENKDVLCQRQCPMPTQQGTTRSKR